VLSGCQGLRRRAAADVGHRHQCAAASGVGDERTTRPTRA
jgi:hypothetical protein